MKKIGKLMACAVMLICAVCNQGCDDSSNGESPREEKRETQEQKNCKEYKDNLTKFLTIRKKREGLSYSINAKVEEEMSSYKRLSQSDKEKKLEKLKSCLEDYQ